jgi:hypothetical protein
MIEIIAVAIDIIMNIILILFFVLNALIWGFLTIQHIRERIKMRSNKFTSGYKTYDPEEEGFGNSSDWRRSYRERMGFEEAKKIVGKNSPEAILEITEKFYTFDFLRSQFRKMIMQHHPDKGGNEEKAKRIIAAYEILKHRFGEK